VAALYALRAVRNLLHGPLAERSGMACDASAWRRVPFILLLAALILCGVFPRLLTEKIKTSADATLKLDNGRTRLVQAQVEPRRNMGRSLITR